GSQPLNGSVLENHSPCFFYPCTFLWRKEKYQKKHHPAAWPSATLAQTVFPAAARNSPACGGLRQPARLFPKKPPALGCAATGKAERLCPVSIN
ncbi:MAG: hypothetical protein ACOZBW_11460, partial [Thermodesulfobacteriota bacterium]